MSLVDWLKSFTERSSGEEGDEPPSAQPRRTPGVRPPRKGGESYAKEWVKVLEDNAPGQDPFNTYTWELKPDATAAAPPAPAKGKPPAKPGPDPFDTYTWELQQGNSPDDPWGLKKDSEEKTKQKDGVNPYDTGIFNASWTGKFDQR